MTYLEKEPLSFELLFAKLPKKSERTLDLEARQDIIDHNAQANRVKEQQKLREEIEKYQAEQEQRRHSTSPFCTREMTIKEFSKALKHKNFHDPREKNFIRDTMLAPLLLEKVSSAEDWKSILTNTTTVSILGLIAAYLPESLPAILGRFLSPAEKYTVLQTHDRFFDTKTIFEIVVKYHPTLVVGLIEFVDFTTEDKAQLRSQLPKNLLNDSPIENHTPRSPFRTSSAETVTTTPRGLFRPVGNNRSPTTNRVLGFSPIQKQQ